MMAGARGWLRATAGLALLLCVVDAAAEPERLNENCVVSILNRTATVNPDGTWRLRNVPANFGNLRVRATCVEDGVTRSGQSEFLPFQANQVNGFGAAFDLTPPRPGPVSLTLSTPDGTLTAAGATVQLQATALYPDGVMEDVTLRDTLYTSSNQNTAVVDAQGVVTAAASGVVVLSALHNGVLGLAQLQVVLSGDSDGDGVPDDVEVANGLDPNNPADGLDDPDGDGLTNGEEVSLGTEPLVADSDGDGLLDGGEVGLGTNPLLADTDGDGFRDGLELETSSDPLDPGSFNLAAALQSIALSPSSFVLDFNTIVGEASTDLRLTGILSDGTSIDLTPSSFGTNYSSDDLTVCNFGSPSQRVFAGSVGTCQITATNTGFEAVSTGIVRRFAPTPLSFVSIPGFANNVDVAGDHAYVAAGAAGLQVVDVADALTPQVIASLDTPGNANDIRIVGQRAYLADGSGGLQVIDISDPVAPAVMGVVDTSGLAVDVALYGNYALIADGNVGLQAVDIGDPSALRVLDELALAGTPKGVAVNGEGIAVVASGGAGIHVVDVSDPSSLRLVSSLPVNGDARDVNMAGAIAVVADFERSMTTIDISDPANPLLLASTPQSTGGRLQDLAIADPFAFGADVLFTNGVPIVNLSDPASPRPIALLDFRAFRDDNATGIAVDEAYVYLTAERGIVENGVSGDSRLYIGQYRSLRDDAGVAPLVRIVAPASTAEFFEPATVPVRVEATDDVGVVAVDFFVDDELVHTDTTAPYEFERAVPVGVSSLRLGARAVDPGNNIGIAEDVVVSIVPDPAPAITILQPAPGTNVIEGSTIQIRADASDNGSVESVVFAINGSEQIIDTSSPYGGQFVVPQGETALDIEIRATDNLGKVAVTAYSVGVIPDPLTTAVGLVTDADGNAVFGAEVDCAGFIGSTGADGRFSVPGIPSIRGIQCVAIFTGPDGATQRGSSGLAEAQPAGTTDMGLIVIGSPTLELLYGTVYRDADGLSTLYEVHPQSGRMREVGPIGFERVSGMDFDPGSQRLYAVAKRADGTDTQVLITVDTVTGAGTEIGPTGVETLGFNTISDISFRNSDATLFAWLETGNKVGSIDTQTGALSLVSSNAATPVVDYSGLSINRTRNGGDGVQFLNTQTFALGSVQMLIGRNQPGIALFQIIEFDDGLGDSSGTIIGEKPVLVGSYPFDNFSLKSVTVDLSSLDLTLQQDVVYGFVLADAELEGFSISVSAGNTNTVDESPTLNSLFQGDGAGNFGLVRNEYEVPFVAFAKTGQVFSGCCGNGIAFSPDDALLHSNEESLHSIDQSTGEATIVAPMNFPPPADRFPRFDAMDFQPTTGVLFGSVNDGPSRSRRENHLATLDTTSANVRVIGEAVDGLAAIAWVSGDDSDNDGLHNFAELSAGTDPANEDSDGDGLLDGFEVRYKFDPLAPDDALADQDGDGLDNLGEQSAGTDPFAFDTDGDGLSDLAEVNRYATDPLIYDTDDGGRNDAQEVLIDGTDPHDPNDEGAEIRLTDGSSVSGQSMPAVDGDGNIHVVWMDKRAGNEEIFYSMLAPDGSTLIDDTRISSDADRSDRPALAVDSQGRVVVVWQDERLGSPEVFHAIIDPRLDDQDGSSADLGVVSLVNEGLLSSDDGEESLQPMLALDSRDRAHVIWTDESNAELRYLRLNSDGSGGGLEQLVYTWERSGHNTLPVIAADPDDNLHIALSVRDDTSRFEIFYLMLDGDSGEVLIDSTLLTPDDRENSRMPSLGIGPMGQVSVVFHDTRLEDDGGEPEIFGLRFDPGLDDQNGDSADLAQMQTLPESVLSANDGERSNHSVATVDSAGNLHVTHFEDWGNRHGDVVYRVFGPDGSPRTQQIALTLETTARAVEAFDYARAYIAVDGQTSYVSWTDDRRSPTFLGFEEVLLQIINPDNDRDGLTNAQERLLGLDRDSTDSDGNGTPDGDEDADGDGLSNSDEIAYGTDLLDPDTDGDGVTDGEEVHIRGTDPLVPDP